MSFYIKFFVEKSYSYANKLRVYEIFYIYSEFHMWHHCKLLRYICTYYYPCCLDLRILYKSLQLPVIKHAVYLLEKCYSWQYQGLMGNCLLYTVF
jgi:hypothetical protein